MLSRENNNENPITINLSQSSQASALAPEQLSSSPQYKTLFRFIYNIYSKIDNYAESFDKSKDTICFDRMHDVITVHGKRGTGKTTFLLSALTLLNDKAKFEEYKSLTNVQDEVASLNPNDFCVLDIMDPTLFACKEHLLHAVLSQINKKLYKKLENTGNIDSFDDPFGGSSLESWQNELLKLARGLKAVGEVREDFENSNSQGSVWEDPESLLENEMQTIRESIGLERAFHRVIDKALKILGKKAFILALDDTDTRPAIGWHVLEIIRRYFTTPQLIVIISGDIDLFATIIRQQHMKALGLSVESKLAQTLPYKERLDGLTEQYLLKILRSDVRIGLGSFSAEYLKNIKSYNDYKHIYIKKDSNRQLNRKGLLPRRNQFTLHRLLEILFRNMGCYTKKEKELFADTIFKNSSRTVMQVLEVLFSYSKREIKFSALAFRFCEIFFIQVQEFGFSPFGLAEELKTEHGISHLMSKLLPNKHIALGLELLPHYAKSSENEAIFALQVNFAQALADKPSIFFSYLFKACLLREILYKNGISAGNEYYNRVADYLCLDKEEPLSMTCRRLSLLLKKDISGNRLTEEGVLTIHYTKRIREKNLPALYSIMYNADSPSSFPHNELMDYYNKHEEMYKQLSTQPKELYINTLSTLKERIVSWNHVFVNYGMIEATKRNSTQHLFSVFSLLSLACEFIIDSNNDNFREIISKNSELLPLPFYVDNINELNFLETDNEDENEKNYDKFISNEVSWLSEITKWSEQVKEVKLKLPSALAARIQSRFFAALRKIAHISEEEIFLGNYIHRCLIAFFNSVLVEEFLLSENKYDNYSISYGNPLRSSQLFIENLETLQIKNTPNYFRVFKNKINAEMYGETDLLDDKYTLYNTEEYPLFHAVFSCPLWGMYLASSSKQEESESDVYNLYMNQFTKGVRDSFKVNFVLPKVNEEVGIGSSSNHPLDFEKGEVVSFNNLYCLLNSVVIPKRVYYQRNMQGEASHLHGKKR